MITPGWTFWAGTIAANGVLDSPPDGRTPTTRLFLRERREAGDRPLVVSYASSPPAEVIFADPPDDRSSDRE